MQMFDINGNIVKVDIRPSSFPRKPVSKSKLQTTVGNELDDTFPHDPILEEFTIPGTRLSVDFFLPKRSIVVEVQGTQHDEFTPHFHGDKAASRKFEKQVQHDRSKQEWAELNGFSFVEIRSMEDLDKWLTK